MIIDRATILLALDHVYPGGFDGFDNSKSVPGRDYAGYVDALLPDQTPLTEQQILDAAAAQLAKPPPVPEKVSARQIRLALLSINFSPSAISHQLGQNEAALVEWEYAAEIRRDHPLVSALAQGLGFNSDAVDNLFRAAAAL